MGLLDHVSGLRNCHGHRSNHLKKRKQLQTVEIKVKMDCEGCERRVKKSVEGMKGVTQVEVDPKQSKLTVVGYVDPKKVLERVRHRTGKKAEFWPYVPFDVVPHPYAPGAYDKKAPPGYVRNVLDDPETSALARASSFEVKYTTAFSDDNPSACVVIFDTNVLALDDTGITLAYAGYGRDGPFLVKKVQLEIKDYKYSYPINPEYVAWEVAGFHPELECCGRPKPYSHSSLIVGFEPSSLSGELWVVHPSGIVGKDHAHAIGRDFKLRNRFLRNNYNYQQSSAQTAVKLAIHALLLHDQVGESWKKNIEVTLITREHGLKRLKQADIDAIIAEIEAKKIEGGGKAASEKERKEAKNTAAKKNKRKAKKAVKKTPQPLDDVIVADLAEMDSEHVEIATLEGLESEADDIMVENATHSGISKHSFNKPLKKMSTEDGRKKAAKEATKKAVEDHERLVKFVVDVLSKDNDEEMDKLYAYQTSYFFNKEMNSKHVEIATLEGPEVDEIKVENATQTGISKYSFNKPLQKMSAEEVTKRAAEDHERLVKVVVDILSMDVDEEMEKIYSRLTPICFGDG